MVPASNGALLNIQYYYYYRHHCDTLAWAFNYTICYHSIPYIFLCSVGNRSLLPEFESQRGDIYEGCFIVDFTSLPLEIALPI